MPPDFLTPERKKTKMQFFGKIDSEKNTKNFTAKYNNKTIRPWYLQEATAEHIYLPKKTGIFPLRFVRN